MVVLMPRIIDGVSGSPLTRNWRRIFGRWRHALAYPCVFAEDTPRMGQVSATGYIAANGDGKVLPTPMRETTGSLWDWGQPTDRTSITSALTTVMDYLRWPRVF